MTRICATFTLEIEITDRDVLLATAKQYAIDIGAAASEEDAYELLTMPVEEGEGTAAIRTVDLDACIRMLLDPGTSPEGLEIQDSSCEHFEVE